ncbi:MAG: DUF4330 family protein [Clostridia bacterium]|nr:DUF4330 family protein [Clostridia bacterium]
MSKRKLRVNILDFLIVAAVVLCIAGALLRGGVKSTDEKLETQTAVITFKVSNVQSASQYCFRDGDKIYSQSLGCDMGRIVGEITATPSVYYYEQNGEIFKAYSEAGRVDLVGTFECVGQMSESGFLMGGTQYIAPGMTTYAYLPNINVNILITDITLK